MFEVSFGEPLLIGAVALVVLGPERLPTVARTIGALVGRAQRFVASVKADIQQEANIAGLDGLRQDLHEAASAFQNRIESEVRDLNQSANAISGELREIGQSAGIGAGFNVVQPGQSQVTADQLALLEAQGAPAQFTDHGPLFAEPRDTEPAVAVDENQLDLFADTAPPAVKPHA